MENNLNKDNLLEIRNLTVEYKTEIGIKKAINHLDLSIGRGEALGLVGEAGAGKTSTALAILRLLSPYAARVKSGSIIYNGQDLSTLSEKQMQAMRGNKISMIFQNPLTSLNPVFTVGDQVALSLRKHRNMKGKEALEEAAKLVEMVGIRKERLGNYPHEFSGGMRQRIGIAAALACNPELLIADEPTTALDVTIQAQILELIKNLERQYQTSLLMITHNLGIIAELCSKVAVMYAGSIVEYGTVREVFKHPMHPYTVGLLGAIPTLDDDDDKSELTAIPGAIADPYNLPAGCAFAERCSMCTQQCRDQFPPTRMINENHSVACWMAGAEGTQDAGKEALNG